MKGLTDDQESVIAFILTILLTIVVTYDYVSDGTLDFRFDTAKVHEVVDCLIPHDEEDPHPPLVTVPGHREATEKKF